MNRSAKTHQFDTKTRKKIRERDQGACIFCAMGYPAKDATWLDLQPADIMHYILLFCKLNDATNITLNEAASV